MLLNWYKKHLDYIKVIAIVLFFGVLVLVFTSLISRNIYPNSRAKVLNIWELWNVWDGPHYLSIAQNGYQTNGVEANFIVFLPLYPLLIFIIKHLLQIDFLPASYVVSFLSSILLATLIYKLTVLDFPKKVAIYTVLLIFIFPTSFFLYIPYTESLFILLCAAVFYLLRRKYYWLSFLLTALAGLTKISGLALVPAILFEVCADKNINKIQKIVFLFSGFLISISGFLVYLFLNHYYWGNFFQFTIFEKQNWYTIFAPFGDGLISAFRSIFWRQGMERLFLGYVQIGLFVFGLLTSIYVLIKVRFSYGIFMFVSLWFAYSMSFWLSMPRYVLSMFPLFIPLALLCSKYVFFRFIWILFSLIGLIFFSLSFIQYGPVF